MGHMTRRRIRPMLPAVIALTGWPTFIAPYNSGCQFVGARRSQQLARSRHISANPQSLGLHAQKDEVEVPEGGRQIPAQEDPAQRRARLLLAAEKLQSQAETAINEGHLEKAKELTKLASERRLLASELSASQVPVVTVRMTAQDWVRLSEDGVLNQKMCCEKAVEVDCNYADGWRALGIAGGGHVRGLPYSEKACYERAVALEPNSAVHWNQLAQDGGGTVQGRTHSRQECAQKALELDDKFASAWNWLGHAGGGHVRGEEYDMRACYERAVQLDETHAAFWYNVGFCGGCTLLGRVYNAKECFEKAVELGDKFAEAWEALGNVGGGIVSGKEYSIKDCFEMMGDIYDERPTEHLVPVPTW